MTGWKPQVAANRHWLWFALWFAILMFAGANPDHQQLPRASPFPGQARLKYPVGSTLPARHNLQLKKAVELPWTVHWPCTQPLGAGPFDVVGDNSRDPQSLRQSVRPAFGRATERSW
jgi:hypothetical protein